MKQAILILGATGVVGRGIVQAAVEAGWPVVAVARDPRELAQVKAAHACADITVVLGSVTSDAESETLSKTLRELDRPLAGVVAAVSGHGGRGRLLDQPTEALRCKLDADLLPHLAAARYLLPLLAEAGRGGSYVLIGGPGSELPWAGYGHRSVAGAALRMLARVLHDEARTLAVRVQLLSVDGPVCPESRRAQMSLHWPTAIEIGRSALVLIERANDEPARAVMRHAMRGNRSGDGDSAPLASTPGSAPEQVPAAAGETRAVQEPDGEPHPMTARCLQDARTLLDSLMFPNTNPDGKQEASR